MSRSLNKALVACAVAVVTIIASPALAVESGGAGLTGKVSMTTGSTIPSGSQVVVYHLATEQTFTAPLNTSGAFEFSGLPSGYFDVAIQTPEGLFVTDRVVSLKPGKLEKITVKVTPGAPAQARSFPGASGTAAGTAAVTPKVPAFVNFLKTPAGTATAAVVGAGVIGAVAGGSSSSTPASPILP